MRTVSGAQRVLATSLALVVFSCSVTRHAAAGPTGPQDLARYALVVEETPDGQVTHAWKPVEDFDLRNFQYHLSAMKPPRGIEDMCARGIGEWAEAYAAEFDAIDPAVDWIKSHRKEILVGTVIVIAGVAFAAAVAVSAGGALILVPAVLLLEDSSGLAPATRFAGKLP